MAQEAWAVEYTDCRGVRLSQRLSWIWHKQSDDKVPAMRELWVMQSTPLLPSLPGPLWPGVVTPDRSPMGQIELNWNYAKPNCLKLAVFLFNNV